MGLVRPLIGIVKTARIKAIGRPINNFQLISVDFLINGEIVASLGNHSNRLAS